MTKEEAVASLEKIKRYALMESLKDDYLDKNMPIWGYGICWLLEYFKKEKQ